MKNNRYEKSCLHCCGKHLGQAAVLYDEARNGYPLHIYLVKGQMAEAESEVLLDHSDLAQAIRTERLKLEQKVCPDFMFLFQTLEGIQNENK